MCVCLHFKTVSLVVISSRQHLMSCFCQCFFGIDTCKWIDVWEDTWICCFARYCGWHFRFHKQEGFLRRWLLKIDTWVRRSNTIFKGLGSENSGQMTQLVCKRAFVTSGAVGVACGTRWIREGSWGQILLGLSHKDERIRFYTKFNDKTFFYTWCTWKGF